MYRRVEQMQYSIKPIAFVNNTRKDDDSWGSIVSTIELAEYK